MIVVADASPLNYLIQIESDDIMERIFVRVFIPTAVAQELRTTKAPGHPPYTYYKLSR